jgi:hypothetical protein
MNMSDRANYTSYCGKGVAEPFGNDLVIQDLQQKLLLTEMQLDLAVKTLCEISLFSEEYSAKRQANDVLAKINKLSGKGE